MCSAARGILNCGSLPVIVCDVLAFMREIDTDITRKIKMFSCTSPSLMKKGIQVKALFGMAPKPLGRRNPST